MAVQEGSSGANGLDPSMAWLSSSAFELMVDSGPLGTLVLDWDGQVQWASASMVDILGFTPTELIGTNGLDLMHPEERERTRLILQALQVGHLRAGGIVYRMRTSAGTYEECLLSAQPQQVDGRHFAQVAVLATPMRLAVVSALQAAVRGASLEVSLGAIEQVVNHKVVGATLAVSYQDPHTGGRKVLGPLPGALAGLTEHGAVDTRAGLPWSHALERGTSQIVSNPGELPDDVASLAEELGQRVVVVTPVPDHGSGHAALLVAWLAMPEMVQPFLRTQEDVIAPVVELVLERHHHQAQVRRAAETDALTGLANRFAYYQHLDRLVEAERPLSVLYLDLDGFKAINDERGHAIGDEVLRHVARRLLEVLPTIELSEGPIAGRLGGDEFAVVLPDAGSDEAIVLADALIESVAEPIELSGAVLRVGRPGPASVQVGISAGIACTAGGGDPDALIATADAALLDAKRAGKGVWRLGEHRDVTPTATSRTRRTPR